MAGFLCFIRHMESFQSRMKTSWRDNRHPKVITQHKQIFISGNDAIRTGSNRRSQHHQIIRIPTCAFWHLDRLCKSERGFKKNHNLVNARRRHPEFSGKMFL